MIIKDKLMFATALAVTLALAAIAAAISSCGDAGRLAEASAGELPVYASCLGASDGRTLIVEIQDDCLIPALCDRVYVEARGVEPAADPDVATEAAAAWCNANPELWIWNLENIDGRIVGDIEEFETGRPFNPAP